jgi:phage terminase large subunit-like protein
VALDGWRALDRLIADGPPRRARPATVGGAIAAALAPPEPRAWRSRARVEQHRVADSRSIYTLFLAGRGTGKLLDLGTMIPTPKGWRKLGELAVGDQVFDESGRPCTITATNDRTPDTAYRLTFSDGATVDACSEHLWVTWTHAERKAYLRSTHEPDRTRFPAEWPAWRARRVDRWGTASDGAGPQVRTTQDIVDTLTYGKRGDLNHAIPHTAPLDLPDVELPVDPWLLGYWLGDGTSVRADLTVADADLPFVTARVAALGLPFSVHRPGSRTPSVRILGDLYTALGALGVRTDRGGRGSVKHVPEAYLWASTAQREALLAGLMDSDGSADQRGNSVEFCSTSRPLADAVVQLARSLGQRPVLAESRALLRGVDHGPRYRVTWRPTRQPFTMPRKVARVSDPAGQGLRNHHRMIVAAERIEPRPMRCLTVDSPHRTYLCTDAMIPTHNTWTAANTFAEWATTEPGYYGVVAPTFSDCRSLCVEGPSGLLKALGDDLLRYDKSHYELHLRNGSVIIMASDEAPKRLRGPNFTGIWGDEIASWRNVRETWEEGVEFATRIGSARRLLTGTPKRGHPLVRELHDRAEKGDPDVTLVRGRTQDNARNLAPEFLRTIMGKYAGTSLGAQELEGLLLADAEGALMTTALIEATRCLPEQVPELDRVMVGVDPAVTDRPNSDFTGIVVVGIGGPPVGTYRGAAAKVPGRHLYVLADESLSATPEHWAEVVLKTAEMWAADAITPEVNQGGDLVTTMVRMVAAARGFTLPRLVPVRATVDKRTRAEPMAGVFEQHRMHVVGRLPDVEDQLAGWVPGQKGSPDQLDATVWGAVGLMPELSVSAAKQSTVALLTSGRRG